MQQAGTILYFVQHKMYWNCFFVFKNSCNCKAVHVWLIVATIFASIVFLWSLSITLFLPVCYYSEKEQRDEDSIGLVGTLMDPSVTSHDNLLAYRLTVRKLTQNISKLSKELHHLKGTVKIYERLGKVMEKDSSLTTFGNKIHQNILLTSIPHSGDVFLGELFNRNPQVFYLFEPFHSLRYFRENRPPEIYESMLSSFVQGIFNCDFAKYEHFTEFLSSQYRAFIHRLSSRALSSPPLCPEALTGRYFNIKLCAYLRPAVLSAICKLHAYTFVKTTQLVDLEKLAQLTDPEGTAEYPFRVVEIMRDPRAIVYILLQGQGWSNVTEEFFTEEARKICKQQLRNIKYVRGVQSAIANRYIMVKYEDIISDPIHTAGELYGFLGISMTVRDKMWLSDTVRNGFMWPAAMKNDGTLIGPSGRNLTRGVTEWQTGLTGSQIRLVEQQCTEVMRLLNYKILPVM